MSEEPTEGDRAEFERVVDLAAGDMYRAIGRCITLWSKMEGSLVSVAAVMLGTEREKAGLVLYSINNFHSWLTIIDELFVIDPRFTPLRPDWIKIHNRLKGLNDTRVSLAHHALVPGKGIEHFAESDDDFSGFFPTLRPSRFDTRSRSKKHMPLGIDELLAFATELLEVQGKIGELFHRIFPIFSERTKRMANTMKRVSLMLDHGDAIRADFGG